MSNSNKFAVNETWIVFRLNGPPIRTEYDGDFHCLALMDAASEFILGTQLVPAGKNEASLLDVKRLLGSGAKHKQVIPRQLLISKEIPAQVISQEAIRLGMEVQIVAAKELVPFTRTAKVGFRQYQER